MNIGGFIVLAGFLTYCSSLIETDTSLIIAFTPAIVILSLLGNQLTIPMKKQLPRTALLFYISCIFSVYGLAQTGTASGTMKDSDGLPLPGVNILIKGTSLGTQTDFDGNYQIECEVGDVLVITYIGFKTYEIIVTEEMFGKSSANSHVKREAVVPIIQKDYLEALKQSKSKNALVYDESHQFKPYNKRNGYFPFNRISDIEVLPNTVKLTYFKPDIFFEVGLRTQAGVQFINDRNLPLLQKEFSQGRPFAGQNQFFGPETNEIFSYGPRLGALEFSDGFYPFDINGALVPIGTGNAQKAILYNNNPYETIINTSNKLFFNIATSSYLWGVDYDNTRRKDLYNEERSTYDQLTLHYKKNGDTNAYIRWKAFLKYSKEEENQPNLNGFQNNVYQNYLATPPSFENSQGIAIANSSQRSFSPSSFNNPYWLLEKNRNQTASQTFIANLQNDLTITENMDLTTKLSYQNKKDQQHFGVLPGTVGFLDGYKSDKEFEQGNFDAHTSLSYWIDLDNSSLELMSSVNYNYQRLQYRFKEVSGFDSFTSESFVNTFNSERSFDRNSLRLVNKASFNFLNREGQVSLSNNSFSSTIQGSKWFLPTLAFKLNLNEFFDFHWVRKLEISSGVSKDINHLPMFYSNLSHNSLLLLPQDSFGYTANNDLFVTDNVQFEEEELFELGTSMVFYLGNSNLDFEATYYNNTLKNSVFPIIEGGEFTLSNVATVQNSGFDLSLSTYFGNYNGLVYTPKIVFSSYTTATREIYEDTDRIPIAGFSSTSKNLIEGYPVGTIVGTAYARDAQGNNIIDDNGYPLVADTPQIIGDPTPNFNLGFSNSFSWKKLHINFVIDYQNGGDVWNGTQNVLNYLGTSQLSATTRSISGFVFEGVNTAGTTNTIPVDFANPINGIEGNRFIRYGYEGVAEDAIVDGTYLNLKSLNINYKFIENNEHKFIRTLEIGCYAQNLITRTKYRGASPYSSLYAHNSGQNLNFFNTPISTEIGLTVNIKL